MNALTSRAALAALLGTLALATPAAARPGDRSIQRTFPIATRLCERVAAGQAPRRLKGQEAQVNQACATLQSSYAAAVAAVFQAEATFSSGATAVRVQTRESCRQARLAHDPAACRAARAQRAAQLSTLRQARRSAVAQYHASIEAARRSFWSVIRSLRGGAGIAPDRPQPDSPVPTGGQ